MQKRTFNIRWHARAGEGIITAAKMTAEMEITLGTDATASPEFGPERGGAPTKAYTRISEIRIRTRAQISNPDVIVIANESLLHGENILQGALDDAIVILNTPEDADIIAPLLKPFRHKVFALDATAIALQEIGSNFPNTPMLGALGKVLGIFTLEDIFRQITEGLGKKVSEKTLAGNLRAAERGYNEIRELNVDAFRAERAQKAVRLPNASEMPAGGVILDAGSATEYNTGGWRTFRPLLDAEKCTDCMLCWWFCPDSSVLAQNTRLTGFDPEHCKGCLICVDVCPDKIQAIGFGEEKNIKKSEEA